VAVAPYEDPEIVIALTIERGGFGSEAAAPAAREVLEAYFNIRPQDIEESPGQGPGLGGPAPLD
jgi:cell division protein FtsI/penicillin-binding protein 2